MFLRFLERSFTMEIITTILGTLLVPLAIITIVLLLTEVITKGPQKRNFKSTYTFAGITILCLVIFLILTNILV